MPTITRLEFASSDELFMEDFDEAEIPEVLDPSADDLEELLSGLLSGDVTELTLETDEPRTLDAFGDGELWELRLTEAGWGYPELVGLGGRVARRIGSDEPIVVYVADIDFELTLPERAAFDAEQTESLLRAFFETGQVPAGFDLLPSPDDGLPRVALRELLAVPSTGSSMPLAREVVAAFGGQDAVLHEHAALPAGNYRDIFRLRTAQATAGGREQPDLATVMADLASHTGPVTLTTAVLPETYLAVFTAAGDERDGTLPGPACLHGPHVAGFARPRSVLG
ncbi:MAG: hypothetical protein CMN30_22245 [Sandaracinus sp.]|mgnify:CR=1 FL=1|nr:hypothetical protein [Sandaracinus sp.]|tara:strand:- start:438 stop:1283 length:846 start_codon:yes stop_codon:yes gene_type:complete